MPGRNRTGPAGMGPMTGRGAGWCTGYAGREPANPAMEPGYGWGYGRGRGFGGGWCLGNRRRCGGGYGTPYAYPGTYGPPEPEAEKQALANQAKALQSGLDWIRERLSEIQSEPAAD